MVSLDPTVGREQFGHRPVLVVSHDAFNRSTRLPVIAPITNGGAFARRSGFAVVLEGTQTSGVVRCDQPRVLDIEERGGRFVEVVPDSILLPVLALLHSIFELS